MGRGRERAQHSSSSSSRESNPFHHHHLTTDLSLALNIPTSHYYHDNVISQRAGGRPRSRRDVAEEENECNSSTFFVKVYMEGSPIGRKLNLLALEGYHDLIRTLDLMFDTAIIWAGMDVEDYMQCHVLTYEDKEGDWLMVGDVPWEMFLCSVRRLKITRAEKG